jgi:hypothetical protein
MKEPELIEVRCEVCNGTGFPPVKQPEEPGRKIYPPRCTVNRRPAASRVD